MLARTVAMTGVLLAGLVTTASAQTYYGPPGYGPYGAMGYGYYGSPYAAMGYYRPYGAAGYYGAYGSASYRPFGWMTPYAYQPTGTFQAYWTDPSEPSTRPRAGGPSTPPRQAAGTRRPAAGTPRQAVGGARGAYAASPQTPSGPMGYGWTGAYAYEPSGTFQAYWTSPTTPATPSRGTRSISGR